jgi:DNA-binding transcriptional ArsR family regulator
MTIPDDVQHFLRDRVETFEQLESLLVLWRQRSRKSSIDDIVSGSKMRENAVAIALAELNHAGLIEKYLEAGVEYYRLSGALALNDELLERLQHAYDDDILEVMKLMTSNAMERLRTSAVRTFSEAFVLRRKKDG